MNSMDLSGSSQNPPNQMLFLWTCLSRSREAKQHQQSARKRWRCRWFFSLVGKFVSFGYVIPMYRTITRYRTDDPVMNRYGERRAQPTTAAHNQPWLSRPWYGHSRRHSQRVVARQRQPVAHIKATGLLYRHMRNGRHPHYHKAIKLPY